MANASSVWSYPLTGQPAAERLADARQAGAEIHRISGLDAAAPLAVSPAMRQAGAIVQMIAEADGQTTLTRVS